MFIKFTFQQKETIHDELPINADKWLYSASRRMLLDVKIYWFWFDSAMCDVQTFLLADNNGTRTNTPIIKWLANSIPDKLLVFSLFFFISLKADKWLCHTAESARVKKQLRKRMSFVCCCCFPFALVDVLILFFLSCDLICARVMCALSTASQQQQQKITNNNKTAKAYAKRISDW